jgi:hypothetical protein
MMYWAPFVAFMLSVALMTAAQRSYFSDLARHSQGITSDTVVAEELRARPRDLPTIVATETARRLRALVTHQDNPETERRRLFACLSVVFAIGCFVWIGLAVATPG